MTRSTRQRGATHFWWDPSVFSEIDTQHFSAKFWQQTGAISGSSSGRNTAYFIDHGNHQLVLRHYYRGGLVGKLLTDQFFVTPVAKSRAMQEYDLLHWMHQQGLPVPRPYAACYQRSGLIYRASILIERIANTQDFFGFLLSAPAERMGEEELLAIWYQVGATVRQMHDAQVYHSDLNCHNILLDNQGKVWLIDFDKCERRTLGLPDWPLKNIARLRRSLEKERQHHPSFQWHEHHWQALLNGYEQGHGSR